MKGGNEKDWEIFYLDFIHVGTMDGKSNCMLFVGIDHVALKWKVAFGTPGYHLKEPDQSNAHLPAIFHDLSPTKGS